eukprot:scaffold16428_cov108-Isochrysis_galbana.AAC.6
MVSSSCSEFILAVRMGVGPFEVRALCVTRIEFLILEIGECLSRCSLDSHKRYVATADFAAAHPLA